MSCGVITNIHDKLEAQGVPFHDAAQNFAGAGVSVKLLSFKKGEQVIQHRHDYPHLSVLLSGVVTVLTDEGSMLLDASKEPVSLVIPAKVTHGVIALTDAQWLCVHSAGVDEDNH